MIAIGCAVSTLSPKFSRPEYHLQRAFMYGSGALFAIVFIVHGILLHGWAIQKERMALQWMGFTAILNALGGLFYSSKVSLPVKSHDEKLL